MLLLAISTLSTLQEKIENSDLTLHKLPKLLGMVQQSERRQSAKKDLDKKNNRTKKRKPKPPLSPRWWFTIKLQTISAGNAALAVKWANFTNMSPASCCA
jgi:hypothetical protein